MASHVERCATCRAVRPLGELLEVVEVRGGRTFYVCRPSLTSRYCFRYGVGSTISHRVALRSTERVSQ